MFCATEHVEKRRASNKCTGPTKACTQDFSQRESGAQLGGGATSCYFYTLAKDMSLNVNVNILGQVVRFCKYGYRAFRKYFPIPFVA